MAELEEEILRKVEFKKNINWSKISINFLDVIVSITKGIIETDLYVKPTDSHQYLLWSSCHPFYCKKGIPYSQALRLNRIYLLPKIHKRLNNVPGRPVISNCGYYLENIFAFLDFHLQLLAQAVKSYIKDTDDFLNKLRSLPKLPSNIILCIVGVVGLYPNIQHEEGLSALRKRLDN